MVWLGTLALGGLGGAVFSLLRLPLPWMLGALLFTMAGALAGLRLGLPLGLRGVMLVVLGVMTGSAFTPGVLSHAGRWAVSILVMLAMVSIGSVLTQIYLRRAGGMSGVTAFFAAAPGGLSAMAVLGGAMGGDEREISLIHSARILLVATVIPFGIRIAEHALGGRPASAPPPLEGRDVLILVACGVGGYLGARLLRIPAPHFIGPMVLSVAVHLTGFTVSRPPFVLVALAQVILGGSVGCRFTGIPLRSIGRALLLSMGSTTVFLAAVVAIAWALHAAMGQSMEAAVLAFAPGGLPEMTLIAVTLNIDVAYVAVHHLARVVFILVAAPLLFRAFPEWHRATPGAESGGGNAGRA
jgi:hypothetical protein